MAKRMSGMGVPGYSNVVDKDGHWTGPALMSEDRIHQLSHWQKPRRVFVCSMADLFHERIPYWWQELVLDEMGMVRQHTYLLLTKRPAVMRDRLAEYCRNRNLDAVPSNWWLGVTAENQAMADERIPLLLQAPAAVRWVSVEPCLESIDLRHLHYQGGITEIDALAGTHGLLRPHGGECERLDWVVVGAESGPGRRPFDVAWAADLNHQCQEAGVACFLKQASGLRPGVPLLIDGQVIHEWPEAQQNATLAGEGRDAE